MKNHEGHKSHGAWMILCCLIPVMIFAMFPFLKSQGVGIKSVLGVLLILACPLVHILMMGFMSKGNSSDSNANENDKRCH